MTLVVDTSVIVKWFVAERGHEEAVNLLETGDSLMCPDIALAELGNVLWRKVRLGEIDRGQAGAAVAEATSFFDRVIPSAELLSDALDLADKLSHSVYDCLFLAAATKISSAVLVTDDNKFTQKCVDAGFADYVRPLRGGPVPLTLTESELSDLTELVVRYRTTQQHILENIGDHSVRGSVFLSFSDMDVTSKDSPLYLKLMKSIQSLSPAERQFIVACCWYGRGYGSQGFDQDFASAARLASDDPEGREPYIVGLLKHLEAGLAKLKSSHPHLFRQNGN